MDVDVKKLEREFQESGDRLVGLRLSRAYLRIGDLRQYFQTLYLMGDLNSVRGEIKKAFARTIFADSWAQYMDEHEGGAWGDVLETAPHTDPQAVGATEEYLKRLESEKSMSVDAYFALGEQLLESIRTSRDYNDPWEFGHYLAMTALGHGVGLWEDFPDWYARVPYIDSFDYNPDYLQEYQLGEYQWRIQDNLSDVEHFSVGYMEECEECPDDPSGWVDYVYNSSCDLCDRGRVEDHAGHGYVNGEITHFEICSDCVLYLANDEIPEFEDSDYL